MTNILGIYNLLIVKNVFLKGYASVSTICNVMMVELAKVISIFSITYKVRVRDWASTYIFDLQLCCLVTHISHSSKLSPFNLLQNDLYLIGCIRINKYYLKVHDSTTLACLEWRIFVLHAYISVLLLFNICKSWNNKINVLHPNIVARLCSLILKRKQQTYIFSRPEKNRNYYFHMLWKVQLPLNYCRYFQLHLSPYSKRNEFWHKQIYTRIEVHIWEPLRRSSIWRVYVFIFR